MTFLGDYSSNSYANAAKTKLGAVSHRSILRPSETEITPASLARSASSGENPPSQPTITETDRTSPDRAPFKVSPSSAS